MPCQKIVDVNLSIQIRNPNRATFLVVLYLELNEIGPASRSPKSGRSYVDVPSDPEDGSVDE